jgi:hypothetical protein
MKLTLQEDAVNHSAVQLFLDAYEVELVRRTPAQGENFTVRQ